MIAAGEARTRRELDQCCTKRHARPTGGSHGRTTRGPTQRRGGAKRRPRRVRWGENGAARGSIINKGRSPGEPRPANGDGQDRADALGGGPIGVVPTDLRPSPAPPPYQKK